MDRKYLLLNLTLLVWLFALLAWCVGASSLARYAGLLAFATFSAFILRGFITGMFKKHKNSENPGAIAATPSTVNQHQAETETSTVIARDVHLEGNIASSSPVYVYGSVRGDIDVKESLVNVMREGRVEGNINCQQLIIDGAVTGQCTGDTVDIAENGTLTGTLVYRTLSIKQGGTFTGQAELHAPRQGQTNVVGLVLDTTTEGTSKKAEGKRR
ncbi:protein CcmA, bactofilin family [Enterobacter sp. NFR05]|uniref:bactofilin family protein n=1 Tax=Citrobacter sp. UYEF32 TaxID=3156347 RepID=UPI0009A807EE|nr:protein CcmA, bactofilin family [Enterobacter sp. NFR05]